MDLNLLYSEHQRSLMRAMASTNGAMRMRYLELAGSVAQAIRAYQLGKGATAAQGWSRLIADARLPDQIISRKPA